MTIKPGTMMTNLEELLPIIVTKAFDHVVKDQVTNQNHRISTSTVCMTIKLGIILTNFEWVLPVIVTQTFSHVLLRDHITK